MCAHMNRFGVTDDQQTIDTCAHIQRPQEFFIATSVSNPLVRTSVSGGLPRNRSLSRQMSYFHSLSALCALPTCSPGTRPSAQSQNSNTTTGGLLTVNTFSAP